MAKAELIIDFYNSFGNATPTGVSNPLVTAIIKNVTQNNVNGAEITVQSFLEPSANNTTNSEFIEQITFQLSSTNPPNDTNFSQGGCTVVSGSFSCSNTSFLVEPPPINQPAISNVVNAALDFPNSNSDPTARFDDRDSGRFFVPFLSEQLILAFTALNQNTGQNETLYAGAKIQSINNGSGSTSLGGKRRTGSGPGDAVPAPLPIVGTMATFGLSRRLRRRIKQSS